MNFCGEQFRVCITIFFFQTGQVEANGWLITCLRFLSQVHRPSSSLVLVLLTSLTGSEILFFAEIYLQTRLQRVQNDVFLMLVAFF